MFAIQRHFNSNVVQGTREDFYAITGDEGLTPSGDGLRLVTIADPGMNLADNQAAVAAALSTLLPVAIACDPSVINADRIIIFEYDWHKILFVKFSLGCLVRENRAAVFFVSSFLRFFV